MYILLVGEAAQNARKVQVEIGEVHSAASLSWIIRIITVVVLSLPPYIVGKWYHTPLQ